MSRFMALETVVTQTRVNRLVAMIGGEPVSHAEFRRKVAGWRIAFEAHEASRWALYFDDALPFAAALLGAWYAGKCVYLCGDSLPATLEGLRGQVEGFAGDVDKAFQPLQPALWQGEVPDWPPLDLEGVGLRVYTSGSTGTPTLIDKRLRQLANEIEALEQQFGHRCSVADPDAALVIHGTVSHQHIYGLLFRVLWPLAAGRAFASRLFFHDQVAQALGVSDSVLVASPAHLSRLPEQADWRRVRLNLRCVFSSGGPLDDTAAQHAERMLGSMPVEIFGSSETGGIAWRCRTGESGWQPLPGVEWRIGDSGLEVRSPFLADRHWLRTDDRVASDTQGGFQLLGRGDRIVKIEERRVSLTAVESAIARSTAVKEIRVLALPGERAGLAAVMVPSDEGWHQLEALGRWRFAQAIKGALATELDPTLHPQRWRYVTALPINAQGKVTHQALQALFQPGADSQSGLAAPTRHF